MRPPVRGSAAGRNFWLRLTTASARLSERFCHSCLLSFFKEQPWFNFRALNFDPANMSSSSSVIRMSHWWRQEKHAAEDAPRAPEKYRFSRGHVPAFVTSECTTSKASFLYYSSRIPFRLRVSRRDGKEPQILGSCFFGFFVDGIGIWRMFPWWSSVTD